MIWIAASVLFLGTAGDPSAETTCARAERARKEGREAEALALFRAAIASEPSNVDAHVGYQKLLQSQGRRSELLCEYEELARREGAPWARFLLGRILHDPAGEETLYREGLEAAPGDARLRGALADALRRQRRFEEAEHEFRSVLELDPRDRAAHRKLIEVMESRGRLGSLVEDCRTRVEKDPDDPLWHELLAQALANAGDLDAALESARRAVELDGMDPRCALTLAVVHARRREVAEARVILEKVLEREPYSATALALLGTIRCVFLSDPSGVESVHEALRLEPEDTTTLAHLVLSYFASARFAEAKVCCEETLRLDPVQHEVMQKLSVLAALRGDHEAAIEWARRALELRPEESSYHETLATVYRAAGKVREAHAAGLRAAELAGAGAPETAMYLGTGPVRVVSGDELRSQRFATGARLLVFEKRYERAKERFREALALDPGNVTAEADLARVHRRLGETEQALESYRRLVAVYSKKETPGHIIAAVRADMAHCLSDLGRHDEALEQFQSVLKSESLPPRERNALAETVAGLERGPLENGGIRLDGLRVEECVPESYCMPASLHAVFRYWKIPGELHEIGSSIADGTEGCTFPRIAAYIEQLPGAGSVWCTAGEGVLRRLLECGVPPILMRLFVEGPTVAAHATVVTGYDGVRRIFHIEDPNWFGGDDRLPYSMASGDCVLVVAPREVLERLEIDWPDREYWSILRGVDPERSARSALAPLEEAIGLKPDHYLAHLLRGGALWTLGDRDSAVSAFEASAARTQADARPLVALAALLLQQRDVSRAARTFEQALEIAPRWTEPREVLAELYLRHTEDVARALAHVRELLASDPFSGDAHYLEACALTRLGRAEEAIESFDRARAFGGRPEVLWILAKHREANGAHREARELLEAWRAALDADPANGTSGERLDPWIEQLWEELAGSAANAGEPRGSPTPPPR